MTKQRIICTVTNDLNHDQRMIRICTSLQNAGYDILLLGRLKKNSKELKPQPFEQYRLKMYAQKGKWFYIEYTIRLFFYLLFNKFDAICCIDLDSILPGLWASQLKQKKRVYDAHELFCEMEEIISRPKIYKLWKGIEKYAVPKFTFGYTIGALYQMEFKKMYNRHYDIVRNATILKNESLPNNEKKYILYQGAVNEGRCFEQLIPAMTKVEYNLLICGEGNFFEQTKILIKQYQLEDKVKMLGYVSPQELQNYTHHAICGITLFTNTCKSNYFSLANRFFDYLHAEIPQVAMNFPEYQHINNTNPVALLIDTPEVNAIVTALNQIILDSKLHNKLTENCKLQKQKLNWQNEEITLLKVWAKVLKKS